MSQTPYISEKKAAFGIWIGAVVSTVAMVTIGLIFAH
jgi:hypothetical protein